MRSLAFFCLCTGILSLSGCAGAFDPFQKPGTWSLSGAPVEVVAQQANNKADLIQGQGADGTNGIVAVAGIQKAMTAGTATGLQTQIQATAPGGSTTSGGS